MVGWYTTTTTTTIGSHSNRILNWKQLLKLEGGWWFEAFSDMEEEETNFKKITEQQQYIFF